ncbi:putative quinol monooxygenase [Falsigemmobacter intermedius]|uniref:Antibiotic biosynthesis monooxygenase n=1 Tax=Falsigemmobacter intermedius TaxID=1553448 RepID=A0A451GHD1_9RHOB|nr:putative quinol monooxygenase [Falsigemmobacter intermedius]RWY37665.1 antibiotic biosynthesis monooxygenase [Falsigemmobacter intermedius]
MHIQYVTITAKPGREEAVGAALTALAEATRAHEPRTRTYELYATPEPGVFGIWEVYEDKEAHEAHRTSAHFQAAFPALMEDLAGRPDVVVLTPKSV